METKICSKCKRELSIEEFNWRDKKKGSRRAECKYCHSAFMKEKYQKKRQEISQMKLQFKCEKCGYDKCSEALDFHHKNLEEKDEQVSRIISNNYNILDVKQEIAKCICLCANCHREFHYLEKTQNLSLEKFLLEEI